ncbi:unnamed protein product [Brassica rapa subsp. trilocularis]
MAPYRLEKNAVHFINRISAMVAHTFAFDFLLGVSSPRMNLSMLIRLTWNCLIPKWHAVLLYTHW